MAKPTAHLPSRGVAIALVGTVIWAATGVLIDYILNHYPITPLTLAFWRDLFTALTLFIAIGIVRPRALRITWRDLPFLALFGGVVLAGFNILWTVSINYNGGAVATVLAYCAPVFTVVLARVFLKEAITWRRVLAVILSLSGCILVVRAYSAEVWQINPEGIVFGLGSGLGFAFYSLAGRWSRTRFTNAFTVTTYGFLFATLALRLTQTPETALSLGTQWSGWGLIALLAVGPTVGGYGLYMLSLRSLEASVASLIASLEPAFTAIMSLIFLGRWLELDQWGGTALVLLAVVLTQTDSGPKPERVTG